MFFHNFTSQNNKKSPVVLNHSCLSSIDSVRKTARQISTCGYVKNKTHKRLGLLVGAYTQFDFPVASKDSSAKTHIFRHTSGSVVKAYNMYYCNVPASVKEHLHDKGITPKRKKLYTICPNL